MQNKRIVIVEDELAVRKGLSSLLSYKYELIEFESAHDFLNSLNRFDFEDGKPTIMLLDFQMSGMNGVELQTTLRQIHHEFPIIFMSGNAEKEDIIDAWQGGAMDFILKPFSGPKICSAISALFEKIESLKNETHSANTVAARTDLPITQREAQVLLLLGKGHRQNEVAQILGIGLRSVKMYRGYIKHKLGLNTPVELTRFCDQYQHLIQELSDKKT